MLLNFAISRKGGKKGEVNFQLKRILRYLTRLYHLRRREPLKFSCFLWMFFFFPFTFILAKLGGRGHWGVTKFVRETWVASRL